VEEPEPEEVAADFLELFVALGAVADQPSLPGVLCASEVAGLETTEAEFLFRLFLI
jgi:hypothetical protein